jgi:hypothetical protein
MAEMQERIKQWLIEEGMFQEEIEDKESRFRFLFQFPEDHFMEILSPLSSPDLVVVLSPTTISEDQIALMEKVPPDHRAEFIWALRFVMNTFSLEFEMTHPDNILQKFLISDLVYEDGLTKDRLMISIRKIWKANLQVIWILQKEFFGMESVEGTSETDTVMYR